MAPPVFDHEHFFLGLLLSCMVSASFLGFDSSASSFFACDKIFNIIIY